MRLLPSLGRLCLTGVKAGKERANPKNEFEVDEIVWGDLAPGCKKSKVKILDIRKGDGEDRYQVTLQHGSKATIWVRASDLSRSEFRDNDGGGGRVPGTDSDTDIEEEGSGGASSSNAPAPAPGGWNKKPAVLSQEKRNFPASINKKTPDGKKPSTRVDKDTRVLLKRQTVDDEVLREFLARVHTEMSAIRELSDPAAKAAEAEALVVRFIASIVNHTDDVNNPDNQYFLTLNTGNSDVMLRWRKLLVEIVQCCHIALYRNAEAMMAILRRSLFCNPSQRPVNPMARNVAAINSLRKWIASLVPTVMPPPPPPADDDDDEAAS